MSQKLTRRLPALLSLFINDFDRIFREVDPVDPEDPDEYKVPVVPEEDAAQAGKERHRTRSNQESSVRRRSRNSMLFTQSGADRLLELTNDLDGEQRLFSAR